MPWGAKSSEGMKPPPWPEAEEGRELQDRITR